MLKALSRGGRLRRYGLLVVLMLVAAVVFAMTRMWQAAPADESYQPRRAIPATDVSPYGANFFLTQEVEDWKIRKTLQMARESGIVWAKQQFSWEEIQLREPRAGEEPDRSYSWEKTDRLISLFEEYGFRLIARLDRAPDWAKAVAPAQGPLADARTYGDFVRAFVARYRGRVQYIQIWNEPNLWYEWGNGRPDPAGYARLLCQAYASARQADPNVYVLSAPLALTTERSERALVETDFLEQMYQNGARECFDILSANAFGFGWPPEDPPSPDKLNFARLIYQREVMVRNGDAGKPVWLNEFGWNASPEGFSPDWYVWQRVSEPNQADFTLRALQQARSNWEWLGVLNIWYFRQVGTIGPDRSDYYFRMVDVDFTPRLVYHALKEQAATQGVAGAGYYNEGNPAVSALGWRSVRNVAASGGEYLVPVAGEATLSFSFRGTGLDLVVTRGPGGAKIRVTIDDREASGVPLDRNGRAVLDLSSDAMHWQETVTVASGLIRGRHTAQITVVTEQATPTPSVYPVPGKTQVAVPSGAGGLDAFVVTGGGGDAGPFLATAGVLVALWMLALALLARELRTGRKVEARR
jgi:hypothetical protein